MGLVVVPGVLTWGGSPDWQCQTGRVWVLEIHHDTSKIPLTTGYLSHLSHLMIHELPGEFVGGVEEIHPQVDTERGTVGGTVVIATS